MDFPKLPTRNEIDLSEVVDKLNSVGTLSTEATSLLKKINDNLERTKDSRSNFELIELKRENDVIEDLINNISDDNEKKKLIDVLDSLQDSIKKNSSYLDYYSTQLGTSVSLFSQKSFLGYDLKNVFKMIDEVKEDSINNLPPVWKGLINIGRDIYNERLERKNKVYDEVNTYYNQLNGNSDTNNESFSNDNNFSTVSSNLNDYFNIKNDNLDKSSTENNTSIPELNNFGSTLEKSNVTLDNFNDTLEKINNTLDNFNDTLNDFKLQIDKNINDNVELKESSITAFKKGNSSFSNIYDNKSFSNLNDVITDINNDAIKKFVELTNDEITEIENLKEFNKNKFLEVNTNTQNLQELVEESDTTNKKERKNFTQLESEESYRKETVKKQDETNEELKGIYKFLTGSEFDDKLTKNDSNSGLLSNILDSGKNLLFGKIFKKVGSTKLGSKFLQSRVGNIFNNMVSSDTVNELSEKTVKSSSNKTKFSSETYNSKVNTRSNPINNIETNIGKKDATDVISREINSNLVESSSKNSSKLIGKDAIKNVGKNVGKNAAKTTGKALLKKIPIIGLLAGGLFGLQRFMEGDKTGALMELASGAAGTLPGIGTAASTMLDAGLMARDMGVFNTENTSSESNNNFNQIGDLNNKTTSEILSNKSTRDMVYVQNGGTRTSQDMSRQKQQSPTVINNYNTTNNNVSQSQPSIPQLLINPVNPNTWQGNGWSGAR